MGVLLGALLLSPPALAFVCTCVKTNGGCKGSLEDGPSLSWTTREVKYTVQANGTADIPSFTAVQNTLQQAFSVWQTPTLSPNAAAVCGGANSPRSDLRFVATQPSVAKWAGYDFLQPTANVNLLVFRDDAWTAGSSADDIIALTTTTFSALTGEILDADIEFNSKQYNFVVMDPNGSQMDLLNTAVHEVGHFLGLAHCASDPNAVCGGDEVMEPSSSFGETKKRTLKCDDLNGLVFKYPAGLPNGYCNPAALNRACGFCTPPNTASQTPSITQVDHGTGRRGCQASAAPWLLTALFLGVRQRRRLLALAGVGLLLGACTTAECDGQTPPLDPLAPLILRMELAGQVLQDPWRVILRTDFADFDGDLGNGKAIYYANYKTEQQSELLLDRIFESTGGVPLNATQGTVALYVRFADTTTSGSVLHLGTRLVDGAGRKSNCYTVDLAFNLNPNATN
ncbi:MAG TPA: matrixin family metalloprotease [Myxococcota bacterium]|nr:matrixin family metalloprotease [Myxococcota bacterium]